LRIAPRNIIISRTDSIGDVVLTLPVARALKTRFPDITIAFMGKTYTRAVIEACTHVDMFIDREDFLSGDVPIAGERPEAILHVFPDEVIARRAKELRIPLRIGATGRLYHWRTCNRLVRLSRKRSDLHEAQLNMKLLRPFGIDRDFSLQELGGSFGLERIAPLEERFRSLLHPGRYHLILHPKSQGSAREWGLDRFAELARMLDRERYQVFISGTEKEREALQPLLHALGTDVTDIVGKMELAQFIAFIAHCDGLVAASTGPLHIAAALGRDALGIYPPIRPIHPGRWAPLGPGAQFFVVAASCRYCRKDPAACRCMQVITPAQVKQALDARAR
jgi:heptosyltransferase-3